MSLLTRIEPPVPDHTVFAQVDFHAIKFVEIFPPIGIARLGDSTKEYFMGPELPIDSRINLLPMKVNKFRDSEGKIRRQATRFRVYAYNANGVILGEINAKNGYTLTWNVHVVNKKAAGLQITGDTRGKPRNPGITDPGARNKLKVDPGERMITRTTGKEVTLLNGSFEADNIGIVPVNLGQLQVDDAGRLIFIAAKGGIFGTIPPNSELLDNSNCVDDACDGWVDVAVSFEDRLIAPNARQKAAVLSGSPKFAWDLRSTTTILDLVENVYETPAQSTNFYLNIWPVLQAACTMSWVNNAASHGHGSQKTQDFLAQEAKLKSNTTDQTLKESIFGKLTNPDDVVKIGINDLPPNNMMPQLKGVVTAALTRLQYKNFDLWKKHKFDNTKMQPVAKLEDLSLTDQPKYLTCANLEMTIGGSFTPGIEACIIVRDAETYDFTHRDLQPPYRVNSATIQPGDLTARLSLPWQADFEQCDDQWWPTARPNQVKKTAGSSFVNWDRGANGTGTVNMIKEWQDLGFITRPNTSAQARTESERTLSG